MRFRALILAAAIATVAGAALSACSSDKGSDTISLDDWANKIEAACQPATVEIEALEPPAVDEKVSDPSDLSDEQLAAFAEYFRQIRDVYNPAVDRAADAGTPEEKANEAEEYLQIQRDRQETLQNVIDAAEADDGEKFQAEGETLGQDDEREAELEKELGLSCDSEQDG